MTTAQKWSRTDRSVPIDATAVPDAWQHVPALDGLRAAAVIGVLLFHAGHLQGGFLGVDLFFALSGFLITSLLIRDSEARGIRLSEFWGRRFRRLLPAVFTMIALVAVWSWLFGTAAELDGVKSDGIFGLVYLANWHFIADSSGYWASFSQPSMFDHLWSLAIEEQFYVLWPLVLVGIWSVAKRPQRTLLITAGAGVVMSFGLMLWLFDGGDPTRVYMGTDTRAASLLVGVVAATAPARRLATRCVDRFGRLVDVALGALLAGIIVSWFLVDGANAGALYRGGLLLHSIACATLVALVVASRPGPVTRRLGWGPLVWIGTLSYGLYLWHWPLYVILSPERTGLDGVSLTVLRIAASFVAAALSFRFVEDPLRHRVQWVRGRRGVAVLVAATLGLATLLIALPEPKTEIAAFDPTSVSVAPPTSPVASDAPDGDEAGRDEASPGDPAGSPTPGSQATVTQTTVALPKETISTLIWAGDSVAFELAPAVTAALTGAGLSVATAAYYGVRLLGPIENRRLSTQVADRLTTVDADTLVIVVSAWDRDIGDDDYAVGLRELADMLPPEGRLIVVTAPPTGDESRNAETDRLAAVARDVADGSGGRVVFIDASEAWASPPVRDSNGDGAPERKADLVHVCPAGAASFGAWFANELSLRFDGLTPPDPATWASGDWTTEPRYDEPVGACAPVG